MAGRKKRSCIPEKTRNRGMVLLMAVAIAGGSPTTVSTDIGILNVTAPPHSLDASGVTDVTKGLQAAILAAKAANLALFLPPGRYLVSDTLHVDQQPGFGNNGSKTWHSDGGINIVPNRFNANVILGSVAALPARPTIVLAPSAAGFGNASEPKNVMKIHNPGAENVRAARAARGARAARAAALADVPLPADQHEPSDSRCRL